MKDKISFVMAFLAAIIALAPFKDVLQTTVISFGTHNSSVLTLCYISFGMLFISAYLYAIDYVRYGFKFLDGLKIFRYIQIAGDSFYLLAIISPFIYFIIWCITKIVMSIPAEKVRIEEYSSLLNTLLTVVSLSLSIYASWFQNKEQRKAKEELLDESSVNAENEAKNLVERNQWNLAIVESYRSLELAINKKLIDLGVDPSRIPMYRSIEILIKNGIIDQSEYQKILFLRDLRNKAVHSVLEHTKEDAINAIKTVKQILPRLETSLSNYSFFENRVLSALTSSSGFFPKHHFFTYFDQKKPEFDARAEGPNFEYIIEVKMSQNPTIIRKAWDRLKKHEATGRRFLVVVPHDIPKVELPNDNVRIAYFNPETGSFENKDEIYKWIYG